MNEKRKTDPAARTWFRSDRMLKEAGKWFFQTREKTLEGPFNNELDAQNRLEIYITLQNSSFLDNDNNYALTPIEKKPQDKWSF